MISIDQDVIVNYNEIPNVYNSTSKNNLIFVDSITEAKVGEGVYEVSDETGLSSYFAPDKNNTAFSFAQMFTSQINKPQNFKLLLCDVDGNEGQLVTGQLPSWDDFKAECQEASSLSVKMRRTFTSETHAFTFPKEYLDLVDNYYKFLEFIFRNYPNDYNYDNLTNKITFNSDAYLGKPSNTEMVNEQKPMWLTGVLDDFSTFKNSLSGHGFGITFDGGDYNVYEEFALTDDEVEAISSYSEFVDKCNENRLKEKITMTYLPISNKILFEGSAADKGIDFDFAPEGTATESVTAIKLTGVAQCKWTGQTTSNDILIEQLRGTEDTEAKLTPPSEPTYGTEQLMSQVENILDKNNINPTAIVLSRRLTASPSQNLDESFVENYMRGFLRYFKNSLGQAPTCVLSLITDNKDYQVPDEITQDTASSRIIMNYSSRAVGELPQDEYLDGAIACYIADLNHDETNIVRNTKGLSFNGITAESDLNNDDDTSLSQRSINYYAKMTNGINMYRNGQTLSGGDLKYIDTVASLNALIIDMKDKLIRVIKQGKLRMNGEGVSLLNAVLSKVCQKYVSNGFLSGSTIEKTDELGNVVYEVIAPYKIVISRSFTEAQITSRTYPTTYVYLGSSVFANKLKVDISNAYLEL